MTLFRVIPDFQKLNFCNFFIHFPCLSALKKIQTFSPYKHHPSQTTFPLKVPTDSPNFWPFQGVSCRTRLFQTSIQPIPTFSALLGDCPPGHFREKYVRIKSKLFCFLTHFSHFKHNPSGPGGDSGDEGGMKKEDVSAEEYPSWGRFWGPGEGEKQDIFSRRIPLVWGNFWGDGRGKRSAVCQRNPP